MFRKCINVKDPCLFYLETVMKHDIFTFEISENSQKRDVEGPISRCLMDQSISKTQFPGNTG